MDDFLLGDFFTQNELADCYLTENELKVFLTPSTEVWKDYLPHSNEAVITMDSSKMVNWRHAKNEIEHLQKNMAKLLDVNNVDEINLEKIVAYVVGPHSNVGKFFREELQLDEDEYLQFMSTVCIQSAYRASSTQLFHPISLLKSKLTISEKRYNEIWKMIAEAKKLPDGKISTGRRETPLWETFERMANELLRSVSVSGREGRIPVALDDDKIWLNLKNSNAMDLFNLKYTTHVKPNRKGIIGHTATTTSLNLPLAIIFERSRDSTLDCFKRCLGCLFGQDGNINLRNVSVHSDRGYMIPSLVFEFLIAAGAEVVGTVKRMAQCWPFTYDQRMDSNDLRTKIDPKGAATLFLKWCKVGYKYLFASAFRNGSGRVATAISTMHTQHQWEGVILDEAEHRRYKGDKTSLIQYFFHRVTALDEIGGEETVEEREILNEFVNEKIEPYTLRQGKYKVFFLLF